jgi:hypothetical protein
MAKQTPQIKQQHWLFGLAAYLWPIAYKRRPSLCAAREPRRR